MDWLLNLHAAAQRIRAETALLQLHAVTGAVAPMVSRKGEPVGRRIQKEIRRMADL